MWMFSVIFHTTGGFSLLWSTAHAPSPAGTEPPLSTTALGQFSCLQWTAGDAPDHSASLWFGQTPGGLCCCKQSSSTRMKIRRMLQSTKQPQQQSWTNPQGVLCWGHPHCSTMASCEQLYASPPAVVMDGGNCVQTPARRCVTVSSSLQRSLAGTAPVEQTSLSYKSQIWSL